MGWRLDGFDIDLEFNPDGKVAKISYHDSEGCGKEQEFSFSTSLEEIVDFHLNHYRVSHKLEPRKLCSYTVETTAGNRLRCTKEPHGLEETHAFEL